MAYGRLGKGNRAVPKVRTLALALTFMRDKHGRKRFFGGREMNLGLGVLWLRWWQDVQLGSPSW